MNKEYDLLSKCIGYMIQLIFNGNQYYARIICVSQTNEQVLLYLTNGLGLLSITKNGNEYNQYAIHIKGNKLNTGYYIPNIDIDNNSSTVTLNSM